MLIEKPNIRIPKSDLRVEYLDKIELFHHCARDIDEIFLIMYGEDYPYTSEKSFSNLGPDSRGICVWHGEKLIGYCGFVQDKDDNHVEFGRLVKHPHYDYDITAMGHDLNRAILDIHKDDHKILYGTTRLWITSAYLEIYDFRMTGSMVYPAYTPSPWNSGMCYPFFGVYLLPLSGRLDHTAQIPHWVKECFPYWVPVFDSFNFGKTESSHFLETFFEDIPPEPHLTEARGGKMAYIPCIAASSIRDQVLSLLQEGFSLTAFFPSWKKIPTDHDPLYISILFMENLGDAVKNIPERFALSPVHYEFTRRYLCSEDGVNILYKRPFMELFSSRKMDLCRRILLKFFTRFYQVKVHSLFREEFSTSSSVSRIFN